LDALTGKRPALAPPESLVQKPVGRLQVTLRAIEGEKAARAKLTILHEDRYIHLDGIVVREARPGWICLEVPPLEQWEESLRWLSYEQRERVESAGFYRLLQEQLTRRYLAMRSPTS
jgi:hypothetical protein